MTLADYLDITEVNDNSLAIFKIFDEDEYETMRDYLDDRSQPKPYALFSIGKSALKTQIFLKEPFASAEVKHQIIITDDDIYVFVKIDEMY